MNKPFKKEMKRTLRTILTGILLTVLSFSLQAQKGIVAGTPFGSGEDSINCLRNTSLYSTYYENKDYNMALQFWRPVFNDCPGSSKNTYIKGEAMYKELFRKSGNKAYIDTVLMILASARSTSTRRRPTPCVRPLPFMSSAVTTRPMPGSVMIS